MRRFNKLRHYSVTDVDVIEITGRFITEAGDDDLSRSLESLIARGRKWFLVDLSGVTFISSMGVGSLIQAVRLVEAAEGRLKLLRPAQCVRQILAISKLDSVYEIYEDLEEAAKSFDEAAPDDKLARRKKQPEKSDA